MRRIIAYTSDEAARAIAEGARLKGEIEAAKALSAPDLERFVASMKQTVDNAVVPAAAKAALRDEMTALAKKVGGRAGGRAVLNACITTWQCRA